MIEVTYSPIFQKDAKHLGKKYRSLPKDIAQLVAELKMNPYLGTDLGDNVRKIRIGIACHAIINK